MRNASEQRRQWTGYVQRGTEEAQRDEYRQEAVDEFLDSADFKLVAHAMALGATVVTREQPAPDAKKRVTIPDACNAFSVPWIDPFSAYRSLGMQLGA